MSTYRSHTTGASKRLVSWAPSSQTFLPSQQHSEQTVLGTVVEQAPGQSGEVTSQGEAGEVGRALCCSVRTLGQDPRPRGGAKPGKSVEVKSTVVKGKQTGRNLGAVSWFCLSTVISDQKLFPLVGFSVPLLENLRCLFETQLFPPTMKTT